MKITTGIETILVNVCMTEKHYDILENAIDYIEILENKNKILEENNKSKIITFQFTYDEVAYLNYLLIDQKYELKYERVTNETNQRKLDLIHDIQSELAK